MKVLVLNSGSSSIKFQLFRTRYLGAIASGTRDAHRRGRGRDQATAGTDADGDEQSAARPLPIPNHRDGIDRIVAGLTRERRAGGPAELAAIGHRVVHGGERFQRPDAGRRRGGGGDPRHGPARPAAQPGGNLDGIEVARELFPGVPSVAVFDTAFHQTMPPTAYRYAIPEYLYREHRVRRYGFHGTSHQYVAERAAAMLGQALGDQCNLITLHLGNGASATAIRAGRSVDTSMGMTPLEGLVMGTRCGDIDPAIHLLLLPQCWGSTPTPWTTCSTARAGSWASAASTTCARSIAWRGRGTQAGAGHRHQLPPPQEVHRRLLRRAGPGGRHRLHRRHRRERRRDPRRAPARGWRAWASAGRRGQRRPRRAERAISARTARSRCWSSPPTRNWRSPSRPWRRCRAAQTKSSLLFGGGY